MPAPPQLILGSSSPRRRALLEGLGLELRIVPPSVDETPRPGEPAEAFVRRIAEEKLASVSESVAASSNAVLLAADTVVALGDTLLGKPSSEDDARRMLQTLAGRTHQVITAVAGGCGGERRLVSVTTEVRFRPLTEHEIDWYVATGEPLDKAGAYGVQGRGVWLVDRLDGSPSNVVGLPLGETVALLEALGLPLPWRGPGEGPS